MSDLMPPPPPRRPAPAALRRRIEGELEQERRRRWFGIAPASVMIAAVAVVIAAVLGVASYQRPMTAEPASTASPAPSASQDPTHEPSPAPTTAATSTGPATLDLDVRELSGPQISSQHKACWGKSGTSQRPSSDAEAVYAQQQRWAGLNGPGWNQSQVLIMKTPGADAWVCRDGAADEATDDFADQLTAAAPVYENYGSSTAQCDQRSAVNAFAEKLFQVRAPVALARVRLNVDGQHGPWQTTEPQGGWVHFSIGLVADDAWSESVTIDFEFLDAEDIGSSCSPADPPSRISRPPESARSSSPARMCGSRAWIMTTTPTGHRRAPRPACRRAWSSWTRPIRGASWGVGGPASS